MYGKPPNTTSNTSNTTYILKCVMYGKPPTQHILPPTQHIC